MVQPYGNNAAKCVPEMAVLALWQEESIHNFSELHNNPSSEKLMTGSVVSASQRITFH